MEDSWSVFATQTERSLASINRLCAEAKDAVENIVLVANEKAATRLSIWNVPDFCPVKHREAMILRCEYSCSAVSLT